MEKTNIVNNSTPLNRFTGIQDNPGEPLAPRAPQFPIHCPLVPLFTKKGTTDKVYLNSAEQKLQYGVKSFDPTSKFYNENTVLSNVLSAAGNIHATIRIKPEDAPAPANVTLYLDYLSTEVPNYKRNSDGSYKLDVLGDKVVDESIPTIPGFRVKYFTKHHIDGIEPGLSGILPGTMTDGTNTSNMVPIMDLPAKYFGEAYSNIGFKINPIVGNNLKSKFITDLKALPYEMSIFERPDINSTGVVLKTLSGGATTTVSFKKNAMHPYTESLLDVDLLFPHNWYNEDPAGSKIRYYDLDNIHFYYENLENILNQFAATEAAHISDVPKTWEDGVEAATLDWFDFTNDDDISEEQHLVNWVTLRSSGRQVNYFSIIKDNSLSTPGAYLEEVTIGGDSITYLRGGGDGTVSMEEAEKFISKLMLQYLDSDSEVMSLVMNKESGMYDVGFSLNTKKDMVNMIAVRPETIVHLCTHQLEYGDTPMTTDEEYATAIALLARAEIFPESEIWATSVCRATIIMGSMEDLDSVSKYRYTQNFELANIFANYLGAADGKMKPLKALDVSRANTILTLGKNYTPKFIPDSFKQTIWSKGVTYSEPYSINQRAFLAVRTIHNNEQSILTSPIALYANAVLCRIIDDAHKEFAGNEKDNNEVFANTMIKWMEDKALGVFDNDRYTVEFEVIFTEDDLKRKYSYNVIGKIYGNVMRTAQVTTIATFAN